MEFSSEPRRQSHGKLQKSPWNWRADSITFYWHQKHYSWLRRAKSELEIEFLRHFHTSNYTIKNKRTEKRWFPSHQVYTKKQKSISKRDSQAPWTREWEPEALSDGVIGTQRLQRQIESLSMDTLGFPISRPQLTLMFPFDASTITQKYISPVFLITWFLLMMNLFWLIENMSLINDLIKC